jgi:hypothetical protein
MGPLKSQRPAEGTFFNFLVLGYEVFPPHALTLACRFIVGSHVSSPVTFRCRIESKSLLLRDIAAKTACTFPCVSVCAHL